MKKSDIFWQTFLNLEQEVLSLSNIIYIADHVHKIDSKTKAEKDIPNNHQLETYSPYLADLLVRCCIEIESISKELYFENGGSKSRGSIDLYFDTDCIALLEEKWKVSNKSVIVSCSKFDLISDDNVTLFPLLNANKRSKAYWAKCYQAVKHDRYNNLYLGNIKAVIQALAALYLLNIYYRNEKITVKHTGISTISMSFGSMVFSLSKPNDRYLIGVVNGDVFPDGLVAGDSPYILKYTDDSFWKIIEARQEGDNARNKYIAELPEMNDPEFLTILFNLDAKMKTDPNFKYMFFVELCKYRIKKRIPSSLPFAEKKRLLITSQEWNGSIRKKNKHLKENELNEQNIDSEIEHAGTLMGYEIMMRFEGNKMDAAFNGGYCEMVLDKGDVRYPSNA